MPAFYHGRQSNNPAMLPSTFGTSISVPSQLSGQIQQQLTPTTIGRVGYSGTRSVHLPNMAQQNGRRHTIDANGQMFFAANDPVYNTRLGRTRHRRTHGTSDYHSLRLELEKRLSHGLQLQGNYSTF